MIYRQQTNSLCKIHREKKNEINNFFHIIVEMFLGPEVNVLNSQIGLRGGEKVIATNKVATNKKKQMSEANIGRFVQVKCDI